MNCAREHSAFRIGMRGEELRDACATGGNVLLSCFMPESAPPAAEGFRSGPVGDMHASVFGIRRRLLQSALSHIPPISTELFPRLFSFLHLRDTQIAEVGISRQLRSGLYQFLAYSRSFASCCSSLRRPKGVQLRIGIR